MVYAELLQADPQGRYGDLARRSLDSLGGVSPQAKAENPRSPSTTPKIPGSSLSSSPQQPLSGVQRWRSNPMRLMNLPIRQKQLLGLFTSELVSILGLVGVGAGADCDGSAIAVGGADEVGSSRCGNQLQH